MINTFDLAFQSSLSMSGAPGEYRDHLKSGMNPASAGLSVGASVFAQSTLSVPGMIGFAIGGMAINSAINNTIGFNNKVRSISIPFSQQFHHNQRTSQLQSYGLSKMGASGSLGNEASNFYGAYGR